MERNHNFESGGINRRGQRGRQRGKRGRFSRGAPQRGMRGGSSRGGNSQRGIRGIIRGIPRAKIGKRGINGRMNDNHHENKNTILFTNEMLINLINKDDNEIIQFLTQYKDTPDLFGNSINLNSIDLITELFQKLSKIHSSIISTILYQTLKNTIFKEFIKQRLSQIFQKDCVFEKYLKFLLNLILLNDKLIDLFSDNSVRVKYGEISEYVDLIEELKKKENNNECIQLAENVIKYMKNLIDKEKHKKLIEFKEKEKEKEKNKNNNNLDNIIIDYKNRDIYLSSKDFRENNEIKIAPHKKSGSYISYER